MLLPLKQGLKHFLTPFCHFFENCCYATSIKTRIETYCDTDGLIVSGGCYATSIKTRIETYITLPSALTIFCCYATSIKTRIETQRAT